MGNTLQPPCWAADELALAQQRSIPKPVVTIDFDQTTLTSSRLESDKQEERGILRGRNPVLFALSDE